jgi:hypothetical protein
VFECAVPRITYRPMRKGEENKENYRMKNFRIGTHCQRKTA